MLASRASAHFETTDQPENDSYENKLDKDQSKQEHFKIKQKNYKK